MKKKNLSSPLNIVSVVFASCAVLALFLYNFFVIDIDLLLNSDYLSFLTGAKMVISGNSHNLYNYESQLATQKEIKILYMDSAHLYPPEKIDKLLPFRNLPFVAFFLTPLTILPPLLSFRLFTTLNVILLLIFLKGVTTYLYKWKLSTLVILSLFFLPVLTGIARGQLTYISLIIFFWIYLYLSRGKVTKAGLMAGLLLIKIQYLAALPFFIFWSKDRKKFIYGFILSFGLLIMTSFLISGLNIFDYPKYLILTEKGRHVGHPLEVITLFSLMQKFGVSVFNSLCINFILYVFSFYLYLKFKKYFLKDILFGLVILLLLIFGVHMTDNEMVLLLFPIFSVYKHFRSLFWSKIFILSSMVAPIIGFSRVSYFEIIALMLLAVVLFLKGQSEWQGDK